MTAAGATAPASVATPSLSSRIYGLGSIFGKTLRDSRRAILLAAFLLFAIFVGVTDPDFVWDQVVDSVDDYFKIELCPFADADRRTTASF